MTRKLWILAALLTLVLSFASALEQRNSLLQLACCQDNPPPPCPPACPPPRPPANGG